jgi:hypothetical protein
VNVLVLGAGGQCGRRIAAAAVSRKATVTALARNAASLRAVLPEDIASDISIIEADVRDGAALRRALAGRDAVINAAGNARTTPDYANLVIGVIAAAEETLGTGGRLWAFGGAAVLDIPGRTLMGVDLPGVPATFAAHRVVLDRLRASRLDWSMLCPGPMTAEKPTDRGRKILVSLDEWPTGPMLPAALIPKPLLTAAFFARIPAMTVTYEAAARIITDSLERNGPYSRRRVGLANA